MPPVFIKKGFGWNIFILLCVCMCVFWGGGMLTEVVSGVAAFPNHQGKVVEFQSQFSNDIVEH